VITKDKKNPLSGIFLFMEYFSSDVKEKEPTETIKKILIKKS